MDRRELDGNPRLDYEATRVLAYKCDFILLMISFVGCFDSDEETSDFVKCKIESLVADEFPQIPEGRS